MTLAQLTQLRIGTFFHSRGTGPRCACLGLLSRTLLSILRLCHSVTCTNRRMRSQQLKILSYATRYMAYVSINEGKLIICYTLHQIAIMGNHQHRPGPAVEKILKNGQHIGVQVIARLIQYQYVGLFQQYAHNCKSARLPTGKVTYTAHKLPRIKAKTLQQTLRGIRLAINVIAVFILTQYLAYAPRLFICQGIHILCQKAKLYAFSDAYTALCWLYGSRHEFEKRRFTSAILA